MSWAKVHTINSDVSSPLNVIETLNMCELGGESVSKTLTEAQLVALCKSKALYGYNIARFNIFNRIWDYILNSGKDVSAFIKHVFDVTVSSGTGRIILSNPANAWAIAHSRGGVYVV